ncbi:VanW family protein, partial [Patescibacteria group bacterium]|nr:VanW family protein [Patescibacteria group bacterium]
MVAKKESKKIDVRQKTKKKVKLTKRPSEVSVDNLRWFVLFLAAFLLLALVLFWAVELVYAHKVAYGLKLGGDNLGGMTREELNDYLEGKRVNIVDGLKMTGDNLDENTVYFLGDMGIWLDIDKCGSDIWGYGKYNSWLTRTLNRARAVSGSLEFKCQVDFDRLDYNNWLGILREKVNRPAVSASIEKRDGELVIIYSKEGLVVDESRLLNDLEDKLSVLDFGVVDLVQVVDSPAISDEMALATRELAQREINQSMQWVYEDWVIDVYDDVIFDMLYFEQRELNEGINQNYFKPNEDGQVMYVGYDLSAVDKYLNDNAWMFEDKPVDAKLAMMEDGPVVIQEGTTGQMVDRTRLIEYLELHMGENKGEVELPVELMESVISGMNIDDLGIKELIASGSSDFSYSPANRIHNIGVGADNFDGMVVAPGEEFSFTKLLGSVDAASGYLPELVIAGNETRPEYGGGLCQVSTTMYRAALDAGFPITARSPHRYRVSYYEPVGLDATVYIPNPDLRFVNDTKHYI